MSSPNISAEDAEAVRAVLDTPYLSIGPRIAEFEERFAAYIGTRHAVGVSSGTAGLHLAVIAAGVGPGDLVITTPFSFVATANCILYERGIPVFVDIDPFTLNLDPACVARAVEDLSEGGKPAKPWLPPEMRRGSVGHAAGRLKAILPVDVFGQPADYDLFQPAAQRHGLVIIEDACEALGAEYKGRKAGRLGHVAVFAFYPNKQMTTGEGAMMVTDDDAWDRLFRSLRNQGRDESGAWLNHVRLGYNYRLDEMSAALGVAQLARIEELLRKRERVAEMYGEQLAGMAGVALPRPAPTTSRLSWFIYVIRLAPEIDRNRVMAGLEERGVPARPYFSPIHLQLFNRERFGYREGDYPVAEAVARSTLALPFSGVMTEQQVTYVCETLRKIL
jgi:dTDP-4-amino-4,6-dideoxygalactose transaminase